MGRVLLVCRLAARDLRRRPAEAALLLLAIIGRHDHADARARPARGHRRALSRAPGRPRPGPTSSASVQPADPCPRSSPPTSPRSKALTDAPGVVDHSGPYPLVGVELEANGVTARDLRGEDLGGAGAWAQGRDPAAAAVDQPELTQGGWVRDGGVVVEAGFADALERRRRGPRSPCGPVSVGS